MNDMPMLIEQGRDEVVRAAQTFDAQRKMIEYLKDKLDTATVALEAANARSDQLQLEMAEARSNHSLDMEMMRDRCLDLQDERDRAVDERTELLVLFHTITGQLNAFVLPLPAIPSKRPKRQKASRNGHAEANGTPVYERPTEVLQEVLG